MSGGRLSERGPGLAHLDSIWECLLQPVPKQHLAAGADARILHADQEDFAVLILGEQVDRPDERVESAGQEAHRVGIDCRHV